MHKEKLILTVTANISKEWETQDILKQKTLF